MGCQNAKLAKRRDKQSTVDVTANKIEKPVIRWGKIKSHNDFLVKVEDRHSLPFPAIKSRLSTAHMFSFYGRVKSSLKLGIVLSVGSRAYIITQEALPGFLTTRYESIS